MNRKSNESIRRRPSKWFSFIIIVGSMLLLFQLFDPSLQIGFAPKLITRFCYNSPNLSTINSQCVLCNYYMFDATLLGCTGSTALTMNITATQAFCVISQCLGQIRQQPVFLGRRKRETFSQNQLIDSSLNQLNTTYQIEKQVEADIVPDDYYNDDVDDVDIKQDDKEFESNATQE